VYPGYLIGTYPVEVTVTLQICNGQVNLGDYVRCSTLKVIVFFSGNIPTIIKKLRLRRKMPPTANGLMFEI